MSRHWYASHEIVIDDRSFGFLAYAFEDRVERDDWATGPHCKAINAKEAERIARDGQALVLEYDGRSPGFWSRRFGNCNYDELGGGRRILYGFSPC